MRRRILDVVAVSLIVCLLGGLLMIWGWMQFLVTWSLAGILAWAIVRLSR